MRRLAVVLSLLSGAAAAQVLDVAGPPSTDLATVRASIASHVANVDLRGTIPLSREWSIALRGGAFRVRDQATLSDGASVRGTPSNAAGITGRCATRPLSE